MVAPHQPARDHQPARQGQGSAGGERNILEKMQIEGNSTVHPAGAGTGNAAMPIAGDNGAAAKSVMEKFPKFLNHDALAMLTNVKSAELAEAAPVDLDYSLLVRANSCASALADGRVNNSDRLDISRSIREAYNLGGEDKVHAFLEQINAELDKLGSTYRIKPIQALRAAEQNRAIRAYALVGPEGETKILDVDLKNPTPEYTRMQSTADVVDRGTINPIERTRIINQLIDAHRRGGVEGERRFVQEVAADLKRIESGYRFDAVDRADGSGEKDYKLTDIKTGQTKDIISYKIKPDKSEAQAKTEKEPERTKLTKDVENLGAPRFADREAARTALMKAGAVALKYLQDAIKSSDSDVSTSAWNIVQARYAQYRDHQPFSEAEVGHNSQPVMGFVEAARLARVADETAQAQLQEIKELKKIMSDPDIKRLEQEERTNVIANLDKHQSDYENLVDRQLKIGQLGRNVRSASTDASGTDEAIAFMTAVAPNLKWLQLSCSQITDAGVAHIATLKNIKKINLDETRVTDKGLKMLENAKTVEELTLSQTNVTDTGLQHIRNLGNLQTIELGSTRVGDNGITELKNLKNLEHLDLENTAVTDAGLKHLSELKKLDRIDLTNTLVTDIGVASLTNLPKLDYLHLRNTKVTNAIVNDILKLKNHIRYLDVRDTKITVDKLEGIKKVSPHLELPILPDKANQKKLERDRPGDFI